MQLIVKIFLLNLIIFVSISGIEAQNAHVELSSSVRSIYDQYMTSQAGEERMSGWTVLVLNSQDRRALDAKIKNVKEKLKGYPYEWNFESPYYKLKVGAFRTRLEAKKFAEEISDFFPYGLEVKADIKKTDYLKQEFR